MFYIFLTPGIIEDNFLLVFDNEDPNSLRQISLDGKKQHVINLDSDNSSDVHRTPKYPSFMTLRPDGKAVFIKYYALKKLVSIDWSENVVEKKAFSVSC